MRINRIVRGRPQTMMSFNGRQGDSVKPASLVVNDPPMVRRVKDLEPVLYDASSCRNPNQPVYTVYRTLWADDDERSLLHKHHLRFDVTDMPPLMLGEEYAKTFGHEHLPWTEGWSPPELFEVLEGEACFLIQRHNGEKVADVSLKTAREGDVVLAPPSCGHVMINASAKRLIVGNLISRYCLQTYQRFIDQKGGAYFLLNGGRLVRNENYSSLPEVRILDASALNFDKRKSGLLASLAMQPELFRFLNAQYDVPPCNRSE